MVLGFKNGSELIMTAFGGTAGVFFVMASLATVIKRDLSGMGKFLFVGAMVLMVGAIINVFVGSSTGMLVISVAAIGIFSAYMLYDLKQIMDGGETNYISATLACTWTCSMCSRACWPCWASSAANATERPSSLQLKKALSGLFSFQLEDRYRLHVRRVREHVDHARACSGSPPGAPAGPHRAPASPGCSSRRRCAWAASSRRCAARVAGAGRPGPWQRESAFARRVDQPLVGAAVGHQHGRRHLEQVARHEPGRGQRAPGGRRGWFSQSSRERGPPACRCPRCPAPRGPGVASGSVKLPRPQNQSITRSSRLHVQQAQRACRPARG
jgi:hypothetical protein